MSILVMKGYDAGTAHRARRTDIRQRLPAFREARRLPEEEVTIEFSAHSTRR